MVDLSSATEEFVPVAPKTPVRHVRPAIPAHPSEAEELAMRLGRAVAAVACIIGLAAVPAAAQDAGGVTITDVVRDGTSAVVNGTVAFDPITEPESVGGVNTAFANPALAAAAGVDLVDAKIIPLEDGSGLRFIWEMSAMPAQVPPEGVRYTWSFAIDGHQYQLQAKRTNMASVTTAEDPVNHVAQLAEGEFFQLRGACTANYGHPSSPMSGCYHLAFLEGEFDTDAKTVSMDLPYETRDGIGRLVAPDFVPGATLLESQSANMSVAAAFQAVAGNTTTSDFINAWDPYFVGERVDLAVGAPTANPQFLTYTSTAELDGGTFSGTVKGLTDSANTIFVRACNGATSGCRYAQLTP